jgi:hypothetical protein
LAAASVYQYIGPARRFADAGFYLNGRSAVSSCMENLRGTPPTMFQIAPIQIHVTEL